MLSVTPGVAIDTDAGKPSRLQRLRQRLLTSQTAFDPTLANQLQIEQAGTPRALDEVLALRKLGYGEAETLDEQHDLAPEVKLLIARGVDGQAVGTIRVVFDLEGRRTLGVDAVMDAPACWVQAEGGQSLVRSEARKLCVKGRNRAEQLGVKFALWRAALWASEDRGVHFIQVLARPPLNDDYRAVHFKPPEQGPLWVVPGDRGEPHEALALGVRDFSAPWRHPGHWMYEFFKRPGFGL